MKKWLGIFLAVCFMQGSAHALDLTDSITQDGAKREFLIHIPEIMRDKSGLPVVILLHGGGGNAEKIRSLTDMDSIADHHNFMAVYPQGTPEKIAIFRSWNAGLCCGAAVRKNIDDVAFISDLIDVLIHKYHVDRERVYIAGHSNGGMMAYRLACELSNKVAAIASNAGQRVISECHPKRPVAILHIHGTNDPCVPYEGSQQCGGCFSRLVGIDLPNDIFPCYPVQDVIDYHTKLNECSGYSERYLTRGDTSCILYKGCLPNAPVMLCTIKGEGHRWPGTTDMGPATCRVKPDSAICERYAEIVGPGSADVDAGELMWGFFKNIRLEQ